MRAVTSVVSLWALLPLVSLSAQVWPPIEPGARVRIGSTDCRLYRQTAEFEALSGDMLVVVTDSTVTCPLGSVRRLEVQREERGGQGWVRSSEDSQVSSRDW